MIPQQNRERRLIPLIFNQRTVRTVLIDGAPWFVAKDVCDILEIKNPSDTLKDFPESERNTLDSTEGIISGPGNPNVNIVNEPGLYRLIFQSRKPEAEQFKMWVFNSVLPQIRRTGFFTPDPESLNERQLSFAIARYFASRLPDRQAQINIGKCLIALKISLRHGEFLPRLASMGVSRSNAARYMKLFRKPQIRKPLKQLTFFEQPPNKPPIPASFPLFSARLLSLFRFRNELRPNAI